MHAGPFLFHKKTNDFSGLEFMDLRSLPFKAKKGFFFLFLRVVNSLQLPTVLLSRCLRPDEVESKDRARKETLSGTCEANARCGRSAPTALSHSPFRLIFLTFWSEL